MSAHDSLYDVAMWVEWRAERLHDAGVEGADLERALATLDLEPNAADPVARERVTGAFLAQVWESLAQVLRTQLPTQP